MLTEAIVIYLFSQINIPKRYKQHQEAEENFYFYCKSHKEMFSG